MTMFPIARSKPWVGINFRGEAAFATNSKDVSVWKLVGLEIDKTLQRVRRVERITSKPESITVPSVCLEAKLQNVYSN